MVCETLAEKPSPRAESPLPDLKMEQKDQPTIGFCYVYDCNLQL